MTTETIRKVMTFESEAVAFRCDRCATQGHDESIHSLHYVAGLPEGWLVVTNPRLKRGSFHLCPSCAVRALEKP